MLTQKLLSVTSGGAEWILYLLIFLSVCSVAIIIERYLALKHILKATNMISDRAKEALKANDFQAIEEIGKIHESFEGRLVAHAIRHLNNKGRSIEEVIGGFVNLERPILEKNLAFLGTLGNSAPFIGLLGTVLGIVKAFADLAGAQGNPSVVMAGISEALVSTAVGLFVAIPAAIAYNFFQRQVRRVMQSADSMKQLCIAYAKEKGLR
ncbi:MAG: MotA/TolQ/ExbB proton channel family protein [Oligoflexia bacterium]|nr:MotA/TolQ/ExbB proton channel family protein [Oligoflexia bacterium]